MPDAFELPRMRRAVVPLMRTGHAVVDELVADGFPCLAAIVRALHHLAEPAARLRRVDAVGIGRRSLHVVNLPAPEVRTTDVPLLPLAVGSQDKRAFARPDQHSHSAHGLSLFNPPNVARPLGQARTDGPVEP